VPPVHAAAFKKLWIEIGNKIEKLITLLLYSVIPCPFHLSVDAHFSDVGHAEMAQIFSEATILYVHGIIESFRRDAEISGNKV
jgi:hypothetical protein